eukprot:TRINITY_DN1937_c0_g2_i2.p2 TRINITY_DN1937_c0_g2~~TRINITY_DN1937_c0_g2_i2.p2  ORF type:complete len:358 (-),score=144.69 TRINITY_DN1937_c0_g2_i2:1534-2586(-)
MDDDGSYHDSVSSCIEEFKPSLKQLSIMLDKANKYRMALLGVYELGMAFATELKGLGLEPINEYAAAFQVIGDHQAAIEQARYDWTIKLWDVLILPLMTLTEQEKGDLPAMEKGMKQTTSEMDSELRRARRKATQASKKDKENLPAEERKLQQLKNELGDKHISLLNGLNAYKNTKIWTWLTITVDAMSCQRDFFQFSADKIAEHDFSELVQKIPKNENVPMEPTSPPPEPFTPTSPTSPASPRSPTEKSGPTLVKSPSMASMSKSARRMTIRNVFGSKREAKETEESKAVKEGYLQVSKKGNSKWEKRYCQISASWLQIYKSHSDVQVTFNLKVQLELDFQLENFVTKL